MMRREWLLACLFAWAHGMACATVNPDEPPSAEAVAAYLIDVLAPTDQARRTPTGYVMLDKNSRVRHTVEMALSSHQCWKIKDGYQCRSTVRTTTTLPNGRARSTTLEISNDYQWRGERLFSARLEAMRP